GLGAYVAARHQPRRGEVRVPAVALRVDPVAHDLVAQSGAEAVTPRVAGLAHALVQRDGALGGCDEPAGAAQVEAPLARRGGHRDAPPLPLGTEQVRLVHPGVLEEQLGEAGLTVEPPDLAPGEARCVGG